MLTLVNMAADDRPKAELVTGATPKEIADATEPPVVARLVIEIRSDGSRTIAKGALEDAAQGETVTLRAEGTSPLMLAAQLVRSLVKAPLLGRVLSRKLLKPR